MIHSLSGGVIAENAIYTFVKAVFDDPLYGDRPYWYISPFSGIKEGDCILAPVGRKGELKHAVVRKVERGVSGQCAPVPLNKMEEIAEIL